MADIEYNQDSMFYLDIDQIPDLVIQKCSGLKIEMKAAAASAAIGCMKDGRTQTHATPGGVEYGSAITFHCPAGNEGSQQKITDWYKECHATSFSGGASKSREKRYTATLFVYDGNGNVGAEYEIQDLFPTNLTQTDQLGVDKPGEMAMDIVECGFTKLLRKI
ncbi:MULTISPECIES: phage tail protein [unclassified Coleofasciculus]|uniref:phage tail protein n=1 Tax=unclassified Coleofasciculus TaxID=2692782 RepID=UPI001880266B|nr:MULTISPECIES: phage tail protein [unclassified Coleofasciculus]MBE9126982.1 phage tail protein [Coleofasciculus sp. LEGE 07081]MBE9150335.1 phage tail protein [Coleofasciculus sp. LEGE 07092]